MTPTQKNFKNEMNSYSGKVKEDFRTRRKRPTISRKISIVSIIFIIWNCYALLTWISPETIHKITSIINPKSNISAQFISDSRTNSKTEKVFNYLSKVDNINLDITNIINKINNSYLGEIYSKESISEDIDSLHNLKMYILTEEEDFKELETNELELLSITQDMLRNLYSDINPYDGIEEGAKRWDTLSQNKRREIIKILDRNGFTYETNKDGSMSYRK